MRSVRAVFLIGEAAPSFAKELASVGISYCFCESLEDAVFKACEKAKSIPKKCVILFSPACASYDQFKNFEERGDAFRRMVHRLDNLEQDA
jgi:UDP-N-acetylmuramoylalanine--D-glutamate ligase